MLLLQTSVSTSMAQETWRWARQESGEQIGGVMQKLILVAHGDLQSTVQMASPAQFLLQEGLCLNSRVLTVSPCAVVKPRTQGKNPRS